MLVEQSTTLTLSGLWWLSAIAVGACAANWVLNMSQAVPARQACFDSRRRQVCHSTTRSGMLFWMLGLALCLMGGILLLVLGLSFQSVQMVGELAPRAVTVVDVAHNDLDEGRHLAQDLDQPAHLPFAPPTVEMPVETLIAPTSPPARVTETVLVQRSDERVPVSLPWTAKEAAVEKKSRTLQPRGPAAVSAKDPEVPLLRAKEITNSEPAWVQQGVTVHRPEGATTDVITLSSERWATLTEAEEQITSQVLELVRQRCTMQLRGTWGWGAMTPPQKVMQTPAIWAIIRDDAVQQCVGEYIDKDFGHGVRGMYRVHAQVTIPQHLRESLGKIMVQQEQTGRVAMVIGMILVITIVLGIGALFLRILRRRKPATELKIPFFSRAEET